LGTGVWSSPQELTDSWRLDRRFEPTPGVRDDGTHARWTQALERSRGWDS
jgi:glycerol kinase